MQVIEAMTNSVQVAHPDQSIVDAAKLMADCDCGSLPVADNDRLVGVVTDRDIVVRAVAAGKTDAKVSDIMSHDVKYCFEEDDLESVARNMGDLQVRRLPVLSKDKRLTGILSLGDIANSDDSECAGEALSQISESSNVHVSTGTRPH